MWRKWSAPPVSEPLLHHRCRRRSTAGTCWRGRQARDASQPVADLLRSSQADSFLLSRNGRLVCEWHADGVDRSDPHLVFSISKSITALVAGILEDQGLLDPSTPVGKLVPEAGNSAYADATVQYLLDMRVSLDFDESYLSQLDYARYRRAMSWNPPSPEGGDEAMLSFLCSLQKAPGDHGGDHTYLSPNSDMLGIVLERISGERFPDLCSRLLWQPLGATADAFITVDPEGAPRTAGGVSCRPHDLLALGQMLVNGGNANGSRIVSERWIADMQANGDSAAWARGTQADFLKTGRYRNNWYQVGGGSNAFLAAGIAISDRPCACAPSGAVATTGRPASEVSRIGIDSGTSPRNGTPIRSASFTGAAMAEDVMTRRRNPGRRSSSCSRRCRAPALRPC
jgi:CubicO group peptidase (beta-lactamase class C family)